MLTFIYIVFSFGSIYFIGLPLCGLLQIQQDRESNELLWILAPFIGISVIILFLQNLVYFNIPIKYSFWWIWVLSAFLWILFLLLGRVKNVFVNIPWYLLLAAVIVYLVHSLGLLWLGVHYYVGRSWIDQFNYVSIAQFLTDHYFRYTSLKDFIYQPYAINILRDLSDRIGQSVFHGFLLSNLLADAKSTFEVAILVFPPLVVLAIYQLSKNFNLSYKHSIITAIFSAVLPALAMVHLESFFSQALCIPFLLMWVFVISKTVEQRKWQNIFIAALILATSTSIYTEFYIIFVGAGVVAALAGIFVSKKEILLRLVVFAISIFLAAIFNYSYFDHILKILIYRDMKANVLPGIYPWALHFTGLSRIWLGDLMEIIPAWTSVLAGFFTTIFLIMAYFGMFHFAFKRKKTVSFVILAIMLLPFVLIILGIQNFPYQYYKLALTISPLFTIGIAVTVRILYMKIMKQRKYKILISGFLILVLLIISSATTSMTIRTGIGGNQAQMGRGASFGLVMHSTRVIQYKLENMHTQSVVINWQPNFYGGNLLNGWLVYFARYNKVWLLNPEIADSKLEADQLPDINMLPNKFYFLNSASIKLPIILGDSVKDEFLIFPYKMYKVIGIHWAVLSDVVNSNGTEANNSRLNFWIGGDIKFKIFAKTKGILILKMELYPGPSISQTYVRKFIVQNKNDYIKKFVLKLPADILLRIPLHQGHNVVMLRALDKPLVFLKNDPRPLLFQIQNLQLLEFH